MTAEQQRDLFLSDITAIRTADALKVWGRRWVERLEELRSCSQLAIKTRIS